MKVYAVRLSCDCDQRLACLHMFANKWDAIEYAWYQALMKCNKDRNTFSMNSHNCLFEFRPGNYPVFYRYIVTEHELHRRPVVTHVLEDRHG